jgi:hypothetical protein
VTAKHAGVDPASRSARAIAERWVRAIAAQGGRRDHRKFAREMIASVDTGRHAPEQRFWVLMAVLRPEVARSPQLVAGEWLVSATRCWLSVVKD